MRDKLARRLYVLLVPALAACLTSAAPAAADEPDADTAAPVAPAGPALQGTVKGTSLTAAVGLKAIGEALHRIRAVSHNMIGECTRQDLVVVSEPDVIGPMVLPAIPAPDGMINTGNTLPPRKKYLDLYGYALQKLIPILSEEMNNTVIPADKQAAVAPQWAEMVAAVEDIRNRYEALVPLVQVDEKDIDRLAVGKQALAIYDDCEKVDRLRKSVFHATKE